MDLDFTGKKKKKKEKKNKEKKKKKKKKLIADVRSYRRRFHGLIQPCVK